jgi:hypothetical protein
MPKHQKSRSVASSTPYSRTVSRTSSTPPYYRYYHAAESGLASAPYPDSFRANSVSSYQESPRADSPRSDSEWTIIIRSAPNSPRTADSDSERSESRAASRDARDEPSRTIDELKRNVRGIASTTIPHEVQLSLRSEVRWRMLNELKWDARDDWAALDELQRDALRAKNKLEERKREARCKLAGIDGLQKRGFYCPSEWKRLEKVKEDIRRELEEIDQLIEEASSDWLRLKELKRHACSDWLGIDALQRGRNGPQT